MCRMKDRETKENFVKDVEEKSRYNVEIKGRRNSRIDEQRVGDGIGSDK